MNISSGTFLFATFLFVHKYLDCKYLLVKINVNTIEKLRNTNDGEMIYSKIGLYRKDRSYPETVPLKNRYTGTCLNEKLKAEKSFTVNMVVDNTGYDWKFTAVLGKDTLSELYAEVGGICNLVETEKHSEGCGLATELMEYCFTEDKVRGVNMKNNAGETEIFEKHEKRRKMAIKNCEHIVYLKCSPTPPTTEISCSGYLTAAINTEHTMMFVHDVKDDRIMYVMNVANIQPEFKKNADGWIQTYGRDWLFCQCKTERMSECQEMS